MVSLKLKKIRKNKNISQEQLAKMVGCDRSYISKIENYKVNESVTLHTIIEIIKALDVKPHEIFEICKYCEYNKDKEKDIKGE